MSDSTDRAALRRAVAVRLSARLALLVGVMTLTFAAVSPLAWYVGGKVRPFASGREPPPPLAGTPGQESANDGRPIPWGVVAAAVAAVICTFSGGMSLVADDRARRRDAPFTGIMLGMFYRMGLPFVALLVIKWRSQPLWEAAAALYLLLFFLVGLAATTLLATTRLAAPRLATPRSQQPATDKTTAFEANDH